MTIACRTGTLPAAGGLRTAADREIPPCRCLIRRVETGPLARGTPRVLPTKGRFLLSDGPTITFPDADYAPFCVDQSPQAREISERTRHAIADAISRHDRLLTSYDNCLVGPTELGRLRDALPDGPINLAKCLPNTATIMRLSLEIVRDWLFTSGVPAVPLAIQARTILMGAGRILYCLGPGSFDKCLEHAQRVLLQEANSCLRALKASRQFQALNAQGPSKDAVEGVSAQVKALTAIPGVQAMGEVSMLKGMAAEVAALLPDESSAAQAHQEHVSWMFHRYSGYAHGYGWPSMLPPVGLWADLGVIAGAASLSMMYLNRWAGLSE